MNYKERAAEAQGVYAQGLERVKNNPVPKQQKFPIGARVKIADELRSSMSHFPKGVMATVEYTYAHAYPGWGGENAHKEYSLIVDGRGSTAWYDEDQLTLIEDTQETIK